MTPNQRFKAFCDERRLSLAAAAKLFGVSVSLAEAWSVSPDSRRHRVMRTPYVKLMETVGRA